MATSQNNLTAITESLTKGMALHAVVLGAQSKSQETEADASQKRAAANSAYQDASDAANDVLIKTVAAADSTRKTAHSRQDKRVSDAKEGVSNAMAELNAHRASALKELGIEIPDYLVQAAAVGGSVRL